MVMIGKYLNDKRFTELKDNFLNECNRQGQQNPQNPNNQQATVSAQDVNEKINLIHARNLDDYNKIFINLASKVDSEEIKLVVIDNMHAVCENFIKADGSVDFIERSNFMLKHARQLKRLAYDFNLIIIVLNNVVQDLGGQDGANKGFFEARMGRSQTVPSLGLMWSNCINDRICLKKKTSTGGTSEPKRTMCIEKSGYLRKNDIEFEIVAQGLKGKI